MLITQHPSLFWVGTETADQIHDEMCHEGSNKIYAAEGSDFCLPADFDGANYKTGELCLMPTKQHWLVKKTTRSFHAKPSRLFYSHKGSVWQKFYSPCTCSVFKILVLWLIHSAWCSIKQACSPSNRPDLVQGTIQIKPPCEMSKVSTQILFHSRDSISSIKFRLHISDAYMKAVWFVILVFQSVAILRRSQGWNWFHFFLVGRKQIPVFLCQNKLLVNFNTGIMTISYFMHSLCYVSTVDSTGIL